MTHPIYTAAQLETKTIAQLKSIAQSLGLNPTGNKTRKQTWIDAIIASQPKAARVIFLKLSNGTIHATYGSTTLILNYATDELGEVRYKVERFVSTYDYELLTECDNLEIAKAWAEAYLLGNEFPATTVEEVTHCSNCPHFTSFGEVSGRGCCQLFPNLVVREHHARTSDCDRVSETFGNNEQDNISIAALGELTEESRFLDPEAQNELNTYLEEQAEEIAPEKPVTCLETGEKKELTTLEALEGILCITSGFKFAQEERGGTMYWYGRLGKYHTGFYHTKEQATHIAAKYIGSPLHKRHQAEATTNNVNLAQNVISENSSLGNSPVSHSVAGVPPVEGSGEPARVRTIEVLEVNNSAYTVRNNTNGNHYVVRPSHPEPNQRCECGHCYFRGAKCKHQNEVEEFNKGLQFLPDNDGYDFKAVYKGETIAFIQEDPWANPPGWEVEMGGEIFKVGTQDKAFNLVSQRLGIAGDNVAVALTPPIQEPEWAAPTPDLKYESVELGAIAPGDFIVWNQEEVEVLYPRDSGMKVGEIEVVVKTNEGKSFMFCDRVTKQVLRKIPQPLPPSVTKIARNLKKGDKIIFGTEVWEIINISSRRFTGQVWKSEYDGIQFMLMIRNERTTGFLYPLSEAEFQVVKEDDLVFYSGEEAALWTQKELNAIDCDWLQNKWDSLEGDSAQRSASFIKWIEKLKTKSNLPHEIEHYRNGYTIIFNPNNEEFSAIDPSDEYIGGGWTREAAVKKIEEEIEWLGSFSDAVANIQ